MRFTVPNMGRFVFKCTQVSDSGEVSVLAYGGKGVDQRPDRKSGKMTWVATGKRAGRVPLARSLTLDQMAKAELLK